VSQVSLGHDHHEAAFGEVERRVESGEELVIAVHSLVESYSVLTRLPPPRRLPPATARHLLDANFGTVKTVALDTDGYLSLLSTAPDRGIVGGRIYDAVILACALKARAAALLTFDERHFRALAEGRIEIVVPQELTET
jgi:predicted nucleic acid-binding protein